MACSFFMKNNRKVTQKIGRKKKMRYNIDNKYIRSTYGR